MTIGILESLFAVCSLFLLIFLLFAKCLLKALDQIRAEKGLIELCKLAVGRSS